MSLSFAPTAFSRRTRLTLACAILAALAFFVVATPPSEAAVLLCARSVTGEAAQDAGERAARKRALESWTTKAKRLEPNAAWHVAMDKALSCSQAQDGSFECVATGRPCTIKYVVPEGAIPMKPRPTP